MEKENNGRPTIQVSYDFNTDAKAVFNAWIDIDMISKWMFGPAVRDEEIVKLENDPHEGGKFSYVVQRGDDTLDHTGTYLEILPDTRLVFTWGIGVEASKESVVSIDITQTERGTHLLLTHEMDEKWASYTDRTKHGWSMMLDNLNAALGETTVK